jgi:hypothetical protein
VTTFDICIQDDSNPTTVLLWNSQTGAYRFCCGGQRFVGTGTVRRQGNTFRLEAFQADRRIVAIDDEAYIELLDHYNRLLEAQSARCGRGHPQQRQGLDEAGS